MRTRLTLAALLLATSAAQAQLQAPPASADSATRPALPGGVPVRRISTASAVSTEPLGVITSVRELPDGRVLLNDGARRRLLLMDTTLKTVGVVLDSLAEVENTYGTRQGTLIPYRGDSTLFVDPASFVMLVLDPQGKVARVRSVPRVQDVGWLTGQQGGSSASVGADARGRLVYRIPARPARPTVAPPRGVPWFPQEPDSAFIVAMDLDTRTQDTVGAIRIPKTSYVVRRQGDGGINVFNVINPMPMTDDWAVLPDGSVAFVRGIDYRIDYLNPDGTRTAGPKLPFDWQRMTDADRERLVDSVKSAQRRSAVGNYVTSMIRWVNSYGKAYPAGFTIPEGYSMPLGFARSWKLPPGASFPQRYVYACAADEEPKMTGTTPSCIPAPIVGGGGNTPSMPTMREPSVVDPAELPSFRPPFATNAVRADADGNLWIRPTLPKPVPGGPVYDVVDRKGVLVDRLQLPPGYQLAGFGRGRVVYLSMRDASGVHLARVRLR
ncbi:hypothetical protein [Roseisolibacter agri]|uniref:Glucose/Sorbosone dehydrogenase domain-containing protein n=1 Tax=Roseisolibacter agri TaxID=2014610 RepID=A0AA37Q3J2_9BACT|nr:hypothetical protein [Roseisolibacter agri]GLC25910.1 hypothetical protein rosag_24230 [Roseisolibacter agri]